MLSRVKLRRAIFPRHLIAVKMPVVKPGINTFEFLPAVHRRGVRVKIYGGRAERCALSDCARARALCERIDLTFVQVDGRASVMRVSLVAFNVYRRGNVAKKLTVQCARAGRLFFLLLSMHPKRRLHFPEESLTHRRPRRCPRRRRRRHDRRLRRLRVGGIYRGQPCAVTCYNHIL